MSQAHAAEDLLTLLKLAIQEDIGPGDATSMACVPADRKAAGTYFARESVVVAGIEILSSIYHLRGGVDEFEILVHSGEFAQAGQPVATVKGLARTLLECERVSLNFVQRLSGIATLARLYADAVEGTKCRVLDTRKTTPGWRRLEKMAAAAGGVVNHRMGLYDAILIKNNHITAAGGVRQALERCKGMDLPVEIEVRTPAELQEALDFGATHLLLDNLTPEEAREWIATINNRATVELSGNIRL
ncbi:MAG TPA: carboxylating nicotinate-nucleotide diphosphorylase, partial [Bryobacteraceae bacterium]|nr:carboxylating nicotinate-nucleotide diphosphorylase [Bryobacteraceae bacterium]